MRRSRTETCPKCRKAKATPTADVWPEAEAATPGPTAYADENAPTWMPTKRVKVGGTPEAKAKARRSRWLASLNVHIV